MAARDRGESRRVDEFGSAERRLRPPVLPEAVLPEGADKVPPEFRFDSLVALAIGRVTLGDHLRCRMGDEGFKAFVKSLPMSKGT